MPWDVIPEIKRLRHEISIVEDLLNAQRQRIKSDPSSFAYQLELESLEAHNRQLIFQLQELMQRRALEQVRIEWQPATMGPGLVPIGVLGRSLMRFQQVIHSIAQSLRFGPKERGTFPRDILENSTLNLAGVSQGSVTINLIGATKPDLFGGSLLASALDKFFLLTASDADPESLLELSSQLGSRAIRHYSNWLRVLEFDTKAIELAWIDLEGDERHWACDVQGLQRIRASIMTMHEHTEEIQLFGSLLGASLLRNRFEFVGEKGNVIRGMVTGEALKALPQAFGRQCRAHLLKRTSMVRPTGQEKTAWTLVTLELVD